MNDNIDNYNEQILDNFNYYPDFEDPNFYDKIYHKKEFYDSKSKKIKDEDNSIEKICSNDQYNIQPYQEFIKNYISTETAYNGLLVFWGVGSGKTCGAIQIAEGLKDDVKKAGGLIYILSKKQIKPNFLKELYSLDREKDEIMPGAKQCTGDTYYLNPDDFPNDEARIRKIKSNIRKYYRFFGLQEFANYVDVVVRKDFRGDLKKAFSNSVFIIDEAHSLTGINKYKTEEKVMEKRARLEAEGKKKVTKMKKVSTNGILTILHNIINEATNLKFILLTATPMKDTKEELLDIVNILRHNDGRPQVKPEEIFVSDSGINEKNLKDAIKGYVSYVRGENPISFPQINFKPNSYFPKPLYMEHGNMQIKQDDYIKFNPVDRCNMSTYQFANYRKAIDKSYSKTGNIVEYDFSDTESISEMKEAMDTDIGSDSEENKEVMIDEDENEDKKEVNVPIIDEDDIVYNANGGAINRERELRGGLRGLRGGAKGSKGSNNGKDRDDETDDSRHNVDLIGRQAGNIIFPINNRYTKDANYKPYGNDGFKSIFKKINPNKSESLTVETKLVHGKVKKVVKKKSEYYNFNIDPADEFELYKKFLFDPSSNYANKDNLYRYSTKFHQFIKDITKQDTVGLVFAYSDFKDCGAVILSLILEINGYDRYIKSRNTAIKSENNLLQYKNNDIIAYRENHRRCTVCSLFNSNSIHNDQTSIGYHKFIQAHYVLFTGDSNKDMAEEIDVINSIENRETHKIKIVIGTRVSGEGIDYKRIRNVFILEPWHNNTRLYQVIGRASRFCSHKDLPENDRNVTVFKYCSTAPANIQNDITNSNADMNGLYNNPYYERLYNMDFFRETSDEKIYRRIERKDILVKKVERILKESAVDCQINKNINHYITDIGKDGTRECDYTDCDYKCLDINTDYLDRKSIDYDTYNIKFDEVKIRNIQKIIYSLYRYNFVVDIYNLVALVREVNPNAKTHLVYEAIKRIIGDNPLYKRSKIYDQFGRAGYIIMKGKYYIFQPNDLVDERSPLYYKRTPITIKSGYTDMDLIKKEIEDYKNKGKSILGEIKEEQKYKSKTPGGKDFNVGQIIETFAKNNSNLDDDRTKLLFLVSFFKIFLNLNQQKQLALFEYIYLNMIISNHNKDNETLTEKERADNAKYFTNLNVIIEYLIRFLEKYGLMQEIEYEKRFYYVYLINTALINKYDKPFYEYKYIEIKDYKNYTEAELINKKLIRDNYVLPRKEILLIEFKNKYNEEYRNRKYAFNRSKISALYTPSTKDPQDISYKLLNHFTENIQFKSEGIQLKPSTRSMSKGRVANTFDLTSLKSFYKKIIEDENMEEEELDISFVNDKNDICNNIQMLLIELEVKSLDPENGKSSYQYVETMNIATVGDILLLK